MRILDAAALIEQEESVRRSGSCSEHQACVGGDHRRSASVDGVDDLGGVNALKVGAGHAQVCVAELALDDRQRHTFAGHLHRVRVAKLMGRNRRRTPASAASRRSSARAPVCDQARPHVAPSMTHRNGPTGIVVRICRQVSVYSHAQSSITTSRRLPPLPRYAGAVVMPSRVAGGRLLAAERRVGGLIGSA